jgi:hypothetical protein
MAIKKFEDIESWKKARKLTKEIYQATDTSKARLFAGINTANQTDIGHWTLDIGPFNNP